MSEVAINLSILLFTLLLFSAYMLKRDFSLISLGIAFNGYAILYFFVGIVFYEFLINDWSQNDDLVLISKLCIFAVVSFNICYLFVPKISFGENYIPSKQIVIVACFLGVASQLFMIAIVGPVEFFKIDRVERFAYFDKYKYLLLLSSFMYIGFVMSAVRYYFTNGYKDKVALKVMTSIIFAYAIATVSRTDLTIIAITIGCLMERKSLITKRTMVITFILLAAMMLFFKGVLYGLFFSEMNYDTFNPGEFINWIRNTITVINSQFYQAGGNGFDSYILTIKSLFVISPDGEPLSQWFINEFYPDEATAGLTYGFSGIAEGFLAIGLWGVVLHFGVFGLILGAIEKRNSYSSIVLSIFLIFLLFRVFRSESYNIVRTFGWYYFYPFASLILMDKLLRVRIKSL